MTPVDPPTHAAVVLPGAVNVRGDPADLASAVNQIVNYYLIH